MAKAKKGSRWLILSVIILSLFLIGGIIFKYGGRPFVIGEGLPECNFGTALKGEQFMLEDWSRNDLQQINEFEPKPSGWNGYTNDNSIRFDVTNEYYDCGRAPTPKCARPMGHADAFGIGGSVAGGVLVTEIYNTKLNLKQQPTQIDIDAVSFTSSSIQRPDYGTVVQGFYITDGTKKINLLTWGNNANIPNNFGSDIRICVNPKANIAYAYAINNNNIASNAADLSGLKDVENWYLGIATEVRPITHYLSFFGAPLSIVDCTKYDTPEKREAAGLGSACNRGGQSGVDISYKSRVGVTWNANIGDIVVIPFTPPQEIPSETPVAPIVTNPPSKITLPPSFIPAPLPIVNPTDVTKAVVVEEPKLDGGEVVSAVCTINCAVGEVKDENCKCVQVPDYGKSVVIVEQDWWDKLINWLRNLFGW